MDISSIYYFIEIPIILKQHIQSDWMTNEPRKPRGDVLRTSAHMDITSSDRCLLVWTSGGQTECLATQTGHWAAQHSAQPMPSSSFHQWAHLVFISDHKFTSIITYTVLTNNVPVCVVHLFGHMENTTAIWRYGGELLFLCLRLCQSDDMVCHVHVGSLYLLELSHLGPFFRALYTFLERPQTSVAASSIETQ